jgi:hypothetical protein
MATLKIDRDLSLKRDEIPVPRGDLIRLPSPEKV